MYGEHDNNIHTQCVQISEGVWSEGDRHITEGSRMDYLEEFAWQGEQDEAGTEADIKFGGCEGFTRIWGTEGGEVVWNDEKIFRGVRWRAGEADEDTEGGGEVAEEGLWLVEGSCGQIAGGDTEIFWRCEDIKRIVQVTAVCDNETVLLTRAAAGLGGREAE